MTGRGHSSSPPSSNTYQTPLALALRTPVRGGQTPQISFSILFSIPLFCLLRSRTPVVRLTRLLAVELPVVDTVVTAAYVQMDRAQVAYQLVPQLRWQGFARLSCHEMTPLFEERTHLSVLPPRKFLVLLAAVSLVLLQLLHKSMSTSPRLALAIAHNCYARAACGRPSGRSVVGGKLPPPPPSLPGMQSRQADNKLLEP